MENIIQEDHNKIVNDFNKINNNCSSENNINIEEQFKKSHKSLNINSIKNNNKQNEIKKKKKKEKEELDKLISERTKNYVKTVNTEYKNKLKKYYGTIDENNNIINYKKCRNIDLYDNIDYYKKEKILKFWEKRRIFKLVNEIIQELIDYVVHAHYYDKTFDEFNISYNDSLYSHWDVKKNLNVLEDNLIHLHDNFKTHIWVENNKEKESNPPTLNNSQELNKYNSTNELASYNKSKHKNRVLSNTNIFKQISLYSKYDGNALSLYNSSKICINKIENEYENKINNISLIFNNKLKEITDINDFISSSWDLIKKCNIQNTLKIINYYGPLYHKLSWPTEYIIPEFHIDIQKNKNLIYWSNDQIKNMIYSNISNSENKLITNNILKNYESTYESEQISSCNTERNIYFKKNKIKQFLVPKKYLIKNKNTNDICIKNNLKSNNKLTLSCTLPSTSSILNKKGIIAIPSKIYFDNFSPYKTYSSILIIKNTTYEAQRIQVTIESEENSKYFRIYKVFSPGNNGLISPGLSVHYKIIFNPVSLKACYATVNVTSSYGDKLIINILAKIKEPNIDIPSFINCNPCLINSSSKTEVIIKNNGGKGKFIIIDSEDKRSCEELHDVKLNHNYSDYVYNKGSFTIIPGYARISSDERIILKIYFKPKYNLSFKKENKILNYIEELKVCLAWDNCEKQEVTIKGSAQEPCITIENNNNNQVIEKKSYIDINTNREIIYSNVIQFETCNINSCIVKKIILKNITDVNIPIKWNVIDTPINFMNTNNYVNIEDEIQNSNPDLLIKHSKSLCDEKIKPNINFDENIITTNYNIGKKVLKIYPKEITFKPNEEIEFNFSFEPKDCKHYDIIAQLLYNDNKLAFIENNINDNELINIRCIGKSEPVKVEIVPAIINIPGKLNVDEKYIKEIEVFNKSKTLISYKSLLINNSPEIILLQLNESEGVIQPESSVKLYLTVIGNFPGKFQGNIIMYFNNQKFNKTNIFINGEIFYKAGTFIFDKKIIDFGIIQLGSCAKESLYFTNNSNNRINWKINLYAKNKEKCDFLVLFEPKNGYLESKKSAKIDMIFIPLWYQLFRGEIICELINDKCEYLEDLIQENEFILSPQKNYSHSIRIVANVLTPKVILQNNNKSENYVCYLNIKKELFITLKNVTLLPTHYKILPVSNENIDINFTKNEGIINGNEEINIKFYVKGKKIGKFDDIIIKTLIDGMVENDGNINLNLSLDIKGLDIDIEIYNSYEDFKNKQINKNNCLNYGNNCKLFKTYTKILRIINTFQVESKFDISLNKYNINYDTINNDKNENNSKKLILRQKNNKIYFYSNNGQQYIKEKLYKKENIDTLNKIIFDKQGAGFKVSPRSGILKPYDVVDIEITAYNNISGIYDDILTINISNGIEKSIPIKMEVKGTPLSYINLQSSKNNYYDIKDLFFSTCLVSSNIDFNENNCIDIPNGHNSVTKTICILNESPKDITLSWEMLINKTELTNYKEYKSIIGSNSELINMSLQLLKKITTVSPEVLEVKQILEKDLDKNIDQNIPVLSVNSLYDCNQTSFAISNNKIINETEENNNNDDLTEQNTEENNISLLSKDISILTLDYKGDNSINIIKDNNINDNEVEINLSKKKLNEEMNEFAQSYKYNEYKIFSIEPKTITIKSKEQKSFKINMKSSSEGIYDGLLYSKLIYNTTESENKTDNSKIHEDIRDIINNESITKLHLFGIITLPRIKFENNLDYYCINLKYDNINIVKTFSIVNPSENIYIFKMIPSNNNIILSYTNKFYIEEVLNNTLYTEKNNKSRVINDDTIIQLKAYESKLITIKLDKNLSLDTYNSFKDMDLKIKVEFINGVYQVIPIYLQ
ncbi:hypothetical protein BCR32DRAFT_249181 [Anaeromyces robustus]|uniref:MSP domain-containing protein n=1 Tax=Anaeromyces robustus TaxID=1754192 RepID=A0A1Y1WRJ2_9FUNG|nr:hypothetical protein BCR32DRAFT_249181 [Anaeromyces robustus]|eukprot:ORX75898.1 hypothetical protein BCR32DRAFT_249181 [Anaeromyces robustus]